ncbi:hypothetical protein KIL84_015224 [Mauremys mutica]|uniref:Uncharacterized protein n=1 Tax=Mauremys mutica TaxID=74926 RepID=A0A9D3WRV3_9SAUR|nr:hypothetical protein KIL84_015224 [Mauremys mutica]
MARLARPSSSTCKGPLSLCNCEQAGAGPRGDSSLAEGSNWPWDSVAPAAPFTPLQEPWPQMRFCSLHNMERQLLPAREEPPCRSACGPSSAPSPALPGPGSTHWACLRSLHLDLSI